MKKLIIIALIGVLLVAVPLTTAKLDWDDILLILTSGMVQNAKFQNLVVTNNLTIHNLTWMNKTVINQTVIGNLTVDGNLTTTGTVQGVTQAEFNTLTDDSMADALHRHSELSASDGTPDPAVSVNAVGGVTFVDNIYQPDVLFLVKKSTKTVGIGTSSPIAKCHIKGDSTDQAGFLLEHEDATSKARMMHYEKGLSYYSMNAVRLAGGTWDNDLGTQRGYGISIYNREFSAAIRGGILFWTLAAGGSAVTNQIKMTESGGFAIGSTFVNTDTASGNLIVENNVGIGTTNPQQELNVVGDANITGNGIFEGNVTAENVWLPTLIFTHTNSTIPVAVGGTWYNVTFDQEDDAIKKRITHTYNDATNTTFIIQDAGTYQLDYTMVFQDTAPAPAGHITSRIVKNSVEIEGSAIEIDTTKQNADTLISHSNIYAECSANDEIKFQFTADDDTISLASHLTYGDHQDTAVISIKRVA